MPSWIRILVMCILGLIHTGLYAQLNMNVRIPKDSKMHLYSPDEYTSLTSFSGVEKLRGVLLVKNQFKKIDGESEWYVVLGFLPDKASLARLPSVRFADELSRSEMFIELNFFDKDSLPELVGRIFGEAARSNIGKAAFEMSKSGELTLSGFRTGIECDRRFYYAKFENFEALDLNDTPATKKKMVGLLSGCS